jgi:hypothetical protein
MPALSEDIYSAVLMMQGIDCHHSYQQLGNRMLPEVLQAGEEAALF